MARSTSTAGSSPITQYTWHFNVGAPGFPSFGSGEIMKVDIDANQKKAIVKFKSVGEKTLLLNFAKLKIIK